MSKEKATNKKGVRAMKIIRNNKGFTLVELVLIIVVLGLLSGVAVVQFRDLKSDAQAAANVAFIGSMKSAISIRFAEQLVREGNAATGGNPDVIGSSGAQADATINNIYAMVQSSVPASLSVPGAADGTETCGNANATWTGVQPQDGAAPANQTWTLTCGTTASDPIYITP